MITKSKQFIFTLLLGMAISLSGFAQDSKITTGVVAFQQGDYEKALEALNIGLENESELKEKNVPKAYYHRAKAKMMLLRQAAQAADSTKLMEYKDFLYEAMDDLMEAKAKDDGKWGDKVEAELTMMKTMLVSGGFQALRMMYGKDFSEAEKKEGAAEVSKVAGKIMEIDPNNYLAYDLRAQAKLYEKDSTAALKDFIMAYNKYKENPPAVPDLAIAYTYYRAAIIQYYGNNDVNTAYQTLVDGKNMLDGEAKRIQEHEKLNDEFKAQKAEEYAGVKDDLRGMEMQILLNAPEKREEALEKFREEAKNNPDNYNIQVAYANLLEIEDKNMAIEQYKKAIALDSKQELALFNLGALYNNMGKDKYDESNDAATAEESDKLREEGNEFLKLALEQFEAAIVANPDSKASIRAAKQIAITIGDMDKYNKYKAMEN